jgi:two-component system, chemotaxis family, CheB/CheR fusion protein
LLDSDGYVADANELARQLFGLAPRDYGLPIQDLEISYRPVELRAPIAQALNEHRPVQIPAVEWTAPGSNATRTIEIEIIPLYAGNGPLGACGVLLGGGGARGLEEQLRQSTADLEQAYQEVQSTNQELATTNEELQSTIEELETTNEELQSTNEELETMNEELQSTNDELHAVNEEVRVRSDELDQLNQFLQSILTSFRGGVVVVDLDRTVRVWNSGAEDLWGLREDEVRGCDFLSLDIGLPVDALGPAMDAALRGDGVVDEVVVDSITRRGRSVQARVSFSPLRTNDVVEGVIAIMDVTE